MSDEIELLKRRFAREKNARQQAEKILESKSLELYYANEKLREANSELEERVALRTAELKETESRFRLLVETASDIIYRTDSDGYFTYANPTALKKIGYTLEEATKLRFTDLIEPSHVEYLQQRYRDQRLEQIEQSYTEFPVVTKQGDTIWLGQNVNFIFNEDGSLQQVNAVARDITEIKLSQTRLQNLISTMQAGILLEDENRKIVLVNQSFCDMFSIPAPPTALVGADCSDSAEESKGAFKDEVGFVERIGEILKYRKEVLNDELLLKDGRVFERDYIPIYVENRYSGHLWNYRDVTAQRNYLTAVKRSEEKYRGIIENMNLGLLEVDLNEHILYANQSFCEMSGFESEEILNKNASTLFVRGENAHVMNDKNNLRTDGVSDAYEIATKNKRGEAKWWLVSGAPLFDEFGKTRGSVGIHLDITQQKKIEKELVEAKYQAEESSKVKEIFLANMSHEIRTPMNGILGMARQLDKSDLDKDQKFKLDVIRSAADNLMIVLNDILDLSKIEAGKLNIENVSFNLDECLIKALHVIQPKIEEKGLKLEVEADSAIAPTLFGDPFRMKQVMFNLIGNSIKFTDKGSIKVTSKLLEERGEAQIIQITVEDTGIGIEQEYLEKIFEKFSQEDRSTARKFGGTGLGMNISKQLVELMGGEIAIESEKGKGTKVIINLPFLLIGAEAESQNAAPVKQVDYQPLEGKSILIAEDNEMNRLVIESTLMHYNMKLHFAVNGKEALELLGNTEVDAVLMDVQMPVMDGIEATQFIRKEMKSDIPIIALTANVLKGDTDSYLRAGMNDTVPKPFEEEELVNKLLKWTTNEEILESSNGKGSTNGKANFSLKKLEEISRGNEAFVTKMISIFIEQAKLAMAEIKEAEKAGDYDKIRKLAHKIKPSLDNLGIDALKENVRKLESIDTETDLSELPALREVFCEVLEAVVEEMS